MDWLIYVPIATYSIKLVIQFENKFIIHHINFQMYNNN